MRWMWAFPMVILLSVALGGCRTENGVNVTVEGGNRFPPGLAGRWNAEEEGWQFAFGADGRITSAVIGLGRVEVKPEGTTTALVRTGEQASFTPGPWTVHYEPGTQELTVRINMKRVRVPMGGSILEGSSTDTFVGPISPMTGVWQAQWTTFTRYTVRTAEGETHDLSNDATYGQTKPLTFLRIVRGG